MSIATNTKVIKVGAFKHKIIDNAHSKSSNSNSQSDVYDTNSIKVGIQNLDILSTESIVAFLDVSCGVFDKLHIKLQDWIPPYHNPNHVDSNDYTHLDDDASISTPSVDRSNQLPTVLKDICNNFVPKDIQFCIDVCKFILSYKLTTMEQKALKIFIEDMLQCLLLIYNINKINPCFSEETIIKKVDKEINNFLAYTDSKSNPGSKYFSQFFHTTTSVAAASIGGGSSAVVIMISVKVVAVALATISSTFAPLGFIALGAVAGVAIYFGCRSLYNSHESKMRINRINNYKKNVKQDISSTSTAKLQPILEVQNSNAIDNNNNQVANLPQQQGLLTEPAIEQPLEQKLEHPLPVPMNTSTNEQNINVETIAQNNPHVATNVRVQEVQQIQQTMPVLSLPRTTEESKYNKQEQIVAKQENSILERIPEEEELNGKEPKEEELKEEELKEEELKEEHTPIADQSIIKTLDSVNSRNPYRNKHITSHQLKYLCKNIPTFIRKHCKHDSLTSNNSIFLSKRITGLPYSVIVVSFNDSNNYSFIVKSTLRNHQNDLINKGAEKIVKTNSIMCKVTDGAITELDHVCTISKHAQYEWPTIYSLEEEPNTEEKKVDSENDPYIEDEVMTILCKRLHDCVLHNHTVYFLRNDGASLVKIRLPKNIINIGEIKSILRKNCGSIQRMDITNLQTKGMANIIRYKDKNWKEISYLDERKNTTRYIIYATYFGEDLKSLYGKKKITPSQIKDISIQIMNKYEKTMLDIKLANILYDKVKRVVTFIDNESHAYSYSCCERMPKDVGMRLKYLKQCSLLGLIYSLYVLHEIIKVPLSIQKSLDPDKSKYPTELTGLSSDNFFAKYLQDAYQMKDIDVESMKLAYMKRYPNQTTVTDNH